MFLKKMLGYAKWCYLNNRFFPWPEDLKNKKKRDDWFSGPVSLIV